MLILGTYEKCLNYYGPFKFVIGFLTHSRTHTLISPKSGQSLELTVSLVAQSCPTLCDPWTVACQAPLYMEFFRQEYWCGLPFPAPGDLPNPGIEPVFFTSPALAGSFFTASTREAPFTPYNIPISIIILIL